MLQQRCKADSRQSGRVGTCCSCPRGTTLRCKWWAKQLAHPTVANTNVQPIYSTESQYRQYADLDLAVHFIACGGAVFAVFQPGTLRVLSKL